jgi:hypothetical protein
MILAAVMDANADRYSSDNVYPGPKFDDVAKPINVNLGFNLNIWVCCIIFIIIVSCILINSFLNNRLST